MSPNASTHPSRNDLVLYGQGRLEGDRVQAIEEHISSCDSCCDLLRAIPDDTLLGRLRQTETETNHGPPTINESSPQVADALPAELRDHPRYRIVKRLGAGGMGVVYKAEHRIMERAVALKVMNQRLIRNQMALERFRLEVKAAARLSHPNIVTAHDADQAGSLQILVMEFVDGISVARQVEKAGPMPIRFACQFARQAAQGLQHAHAKGMIHRDIKPQNLMLTRDGRVKILDFGLAKYAREANPADSAPVTDADPQIDSRLTQDGTALGTPDYMAPEQVHSAATVDIRADIYSLGCTLYFMLAGHSPFPHGTAAEKLLSHLEHEPVDMAVVRPEVPAALRDIIHRMMAKNPADRFATPADVAEVLLPFTKVESQRTAAAESPLSLDLGNLADLAEFGETVELPSPQRTKVSKALGWQAALTALRKQKRYAVPLLAVGVLLLAAMFGWSTIRPLLFPSTQPKKLIANNQTPSKNGGGEFSKSSNVADMSFKTPYGERRGMPNVPGDVGARILIVVPHDEFWVPDVANLRKAAESVGAKVRIASSQRSPAQPSRSGPFRNTEPVDLLLSEAKASDYDTIIFTGANPSEALEHLHDKNYEQAARAVIQDLQSQGKPIASICMGSRVLADLGFLKGRAAARCQYQPTDADYEEKARWVNERVRSDGPFITGKDQDAAKELMREIVARIR